MIDEIRYVMRHIVNNIPFPEEDTLATESEIEDVFTYHAPNDLQIGQMQEIRAHLRAAATAINRNTPESPYRTIAFRLLHEAGMLANAAIVLEGRSLR